MDLKAVAYRILPKPIVSELRHRKHLRDLPTAKEPEEPQVRSLIREGNVVLDIGANFGVFTKLFSELVGVDGSVMAFEPTPETFRTLSAGVNRLGLRNVKTFNKAVSDGVGTVTMQVPQYANAKGDNLYESHIVNSNASELSNSFRVQTVTIDSLQLSEVDFIKIDVEGHELQVVRGGAETIKRFRPTLMVEVTSPDTVAFVCEQLGYERPIAISAGNQLFQYPSR